MEKISSFQKDHNNLTQGFYFSGEISGVSTFDLRFKKPNQNDFLSTSSMHSIEHMLATILRNSSEKQNIIYFGPMGCRTGFYLLTINLNIEQAIKLIKCSIETALQLQVVPGAEQIECGNFEDHNILQAKKDLIQYLEILNNLY